VVVDLSTHSAGGLTHLDFELAGKMQALAGK
jgi:pterin-4a-carbinolamine dehydratase